MSKKEQIPTENREVNNELFVPLVPNDATTIVRIEYGDISWVPTQMPKELLIDIGYLQYLQRILKLEGKIQLLGMHEDSDEGIGIGSVSGDVATASRVISGKRIVKSKTEFDPKKQTHKIYLNVQKMKMIAEKNKNSREVLAKQLSTEIQKSMVDLVMQDIKRITSEEIQFCFKVLASVVIIEGTCGNLLALTGKALGTRPEGLQADEIISLAFAIYLLSCFVAGSAKYLLKEMPLSEQTDESFFEELTKIAERLGIQNHEKLAPLAVIVLLAEKLSPHMIIFPGLKNVSRMIETEKSRFSKRRIVKPTESKFEKN